MLYTLIMHEHELSHRVERTRNRHSRAVYRDGAVVIRLARNLTTMEEHKHIEYLLRRMAPVIEKERTRTAIDPFRPLLDGESRLDLTLGDGRMITFELSAGKRTKSQQTATGWHITISPRITRRSLHRYLWSLLAASEYDHLLALTESIDRETFNTGFRGFRLRYMTSQWGSCSAHGNIVLNTALLMLPEPLLRYVITHELAHRLHRNHGKRYWQTVERVLPAYKDLRSQMRKYRLCAL